MFTTCADDDAICVLCYEAGDTASGIWEKWPKNYGIWEKFRKKQGSGKFEKKMWDVGKSTYIAKNIRK